MDQTLLQGVVFESFADQSNNMYALDIGQTCNPAPILDGGVSFLATGQPGFITHMANGFLASAALLKKQTKMFPVGNKQPVHRWHKHPNVPPENVQFQTQN